MADRILIVEDERITAEDLRDILNGLGYEVTGVVGTGHEALREAERNPPDLALMDIRIKGDMDGTEIAEILRERFDIPVIYLTAHADRATLTRAKLARPLGYLVKPFQESELQASVEIALYRHRHEREARERHRRLNDVVTNLMQGVISVDAARIVLVFNAAAEALTGWTADEALGKPIEEVFRLVDRETGNLARLELNEGSSIGKLAEIIDCLLVTKSGGHRRISGTVSSVAASPGGLRGFVIMFESADVAAADPFRDSRLKTTPEGEILRFGRFQVVAVSDEMKKVIAFALRVARSEATTVLIEGESGTGKDLIAQFIHYSSRLLSGPYVPVNCAAIPESLVESELFGHQRGAFTDARADKKGLFEMANGGTLFLDEIGELSLNVQAKLLRAIEDTTFRRVGGVHDVEVHLRIIAATNRRVLEAVQEGRFRTDLFHRLSVIPIMIPPLRERVADILPLARHFTLEYARRYKSKVSAISPEAGDVLAGHDWSGNVRELRNVIERGVLMEDTNLLQIGSIVFVTSPGTEFPLGTPQEPVEASGLSLKESERKLIVRALERTGGNQTKAARLLGITRDMVRHRIKTLGLKVPDRDL
jgi:two-component system response regulator AtoC